MASGLLLSRPMVSLLHEAPIILFRDRPELVRELFARRLGVRLPSRAKIRVSEAAITEIVPTEYRADLVLLFGGKKPTFGVVIEAQLARDRNKRFVWPFYVAGLRAKLRVPCCLLVIAPKPSVAKWAATPIDLGQPGCQFVPVVLGPSAIPVITDVEEARRDPELAVLSAVAHGRGPLGAEIANAALAGTSVLDSERATQYTDFVLAAIARATLEALMESGKWEYQTEFVKRIVREKAEAEARGEARGKAEGKARGKAEALLAILATRGFPVPDSVQQRILSCTDLELLDRWIRQTVVAGSLDEALK